MVEVLLRKLNNAKDSGKHIVNTIKQGARYAKEQAKPIIRDAIRTLKGTITEAKNECQIGFIYIKKACTKQYDRCVEVLKGKQALTQLMVAMLITLISMSSVEILSKINMTEEHTIDEKIMTNTQAAHDAAEKVLTNYADSKGLKITIEGKGISGTVVSQVYNENGYMGTVLCNDTTALRITSNTAVKEFNDITGRRGLQEEDHAMRVIRSELKDTPVNDKQRQLQNILGEDVRIIWSMKCQNEDKQVDYWAIVQSDKRYTLVVRYIDGKKADIIAYEITDDVEM